MPDSLKITRQKRSGFFADCTRQEFERRLGRLREEMERSGVDGLLLTQQSNVRYATGFYEVGWIVPAFFYHRGGYPLWEVSNKYGLEDVVLVTETGHEVLTPKSIIGRDIRVA
jgi:hypothetical protein